MKPTLFTVSANGHERHVFTDSPAKALTWCLSHDDVIGKADTIMLQRRTDVMPRDGHNADPGRAVVYVEAEAVAERDKLYLRIMHFAEVPDPE